MVINWAQDAFGGKEQIALLMQQVGRPCALADADQQDAADTLAEAGEAPVGVSLQDGYLLVNFTGWTAGMTAIPQIRTTMGGVTPNVDQPDRSMYNEEEAMPLFYQEAAV